MVSGTGISLSELGCQILHICLGELLSLFPELYTAFGALSCTPDETMQGIGTDGETIRFAPVDLLRRYRDNPAAVRRGYLHMLLHCLYLHPFDGTPPSRLWDLALDMTVERMIEQEAVPRLALGDNSVRDACFRMTKNLPAVRVYDLLVQEAFPFSTEELEEAFCLDNHALWRTQPGPPNAIRKKWSALSAGMEQGGHSAGTSAGNQSETIRVSPKGLCDYRTFLRRFTMPREEVILDPESFDLVFYSYGIEYYGNLPLIEPLEYQEVNRLAELVIAIDTSGSCSAKTVQQFLAETWEIISCRENFFREMKVYLIQCDCRVQHVTVIRSPEDWRRSCGEITIQGRVGTDFTPVFRYVEELRKKKELRDLRALLYFSDGDGVYPRQRTDYETAFVFLSENDKIDYVPSWAARLLAAGQRGGRA
ncbi:MAG: hypothetical protein K2O18_19685 [Oscillospiraceae bacterium]|nr:hypothetical protein [Oscillospiraceae bacterium]